MEGEASIKQQQNLYEVVRAERNVNSKKLLEAQGEIDEMKRKFKVMNHLVEQLKEEINSKDVAIIKEHYDHQKVCLVCVHPPIQAHKCSLGIHSNPPYLMTSQQLFVYLDFITLFSLVMTFPFYSSFKNKLPRFEVLVCMHEC